MGDYIFQSMTVAKKDLYNTIKTLLTNAGWKNLSSKATTDFDVFYSKGEAGDKNLYFQVRETDSSNANPISTSNGTIITVRLINKYTPGATNASGVFERPSEAWYQLVLAPNNAIHPDANVQLYYFINKNKIVFALEYPLAYTLAGGSLFWIGMPDVPFDVEKDSTGVMIAGTSINFASNNLVAITGSPYVPTTASYTLSVSSILPPKNLNVSKNVIMSDLMFGNSNEGFRGSIEGIYTMVYDNVLNGDILFDSDGKKYRVFIVKNYTGMYSSFPTYCLVFQI